MKYIYTHTIRATELSNSIDKSFMKFDSPPKARLWISSENKARVALNAHGTLVSVNHA